MYLTVEELEREQQMKTIQSVDVGQEKTREPLDMEQKYKVVIKNIDGWFGTKHALKNINLAY